MATPSSSTIITQRCGGDATVILGSGAPATAVVEWDFTDGRRRMKTNGCSCSWQGRGDGGGASGGAVAGTVAGAAADAVTLHVQHADGTDRIVACPLRGRLTVATNSTVTILL